MTTPLLTPGIVGDAALKVVAALILPAGITTPASLTVTGGTVAGTSTVPTGDSAVYVGLTETAAATGSVYSADAEIGGAANLPDSTSRPYTFEARVVAGNPTTYADIKAAFLASNTYLWTRDVPSTLNGGMLRGGAWNGDVPAIRSKTDQLTFTAANKLDAKLTADGLDLIPTTDPGGVANTFPKMVVQTWRRFFKAASKTPTQVKTLADDGTTVRTTQAITSDGAGNETQGAAA